jgi:hypothetical protein
MSEKGWEREFEALFSDTVPKPDPGQSSGSRAALLRDTSLLERLSAAMRDEAQRPRVLNALLTGSAIGEVVAVIALIVVLYRFFPSPFGDAGFLLTSAIFGGMTLLLLFVQWQLARRLIQVEQLARRQREQLGQAVVAIQRYREELERADELIRTQEQE